MSLSDPLGDMLTRIRNGQMRGKDSVLMPASRFRGNVLDVLQREGYIKGFKKREIANNKNEFKIELVTASWTLVFSSSVINGCSETQNSLLAISTETGNVSICGSLYTKSLASTRPLSKKFSFRS